MQNNPEDITWQSIQDSLGTLEQSADGHSQATRGIVTVASGIRLFVKFAQDGDAAKWVNCEKRAYDWLQKHDYPYAPRMVAEGKNGFALPDYSDWDWSSKWDTPKLDALFTALDELASLSKEAANHFDQTDYIGNSWDTAPTDIDVIDWAMPLLDESQKRDITDLITNPVTRSEYYSWASTEPWRGNDLVHYDARRDNFAFNPTTGEGLLLDWSWVSIGNKVFDKNKVLINAYMSGSDDWRKYQHLLDKASLAFLAGFWLGRIASEKPSSASRQHLRMLQLRSVIAAYRLSKEVQ